VVYDGSGRSDEGKYQMSLRRIEPRPVILIHRMNIVLKFLKMKIVYLSYSAERKRKEA
jgi:hypothetical protein